MEFAINGLETVKRQHYIETSGTTLCAWVGAQEVVYCSLITDSASGGPHSISPCKHLPISNYIRAADYWYHIQRDYNDCNESDCIILDSNGRHYTVKCNSSELTNVI